MQFANICLDEINKGDIVRVKRLLYWHYGIIYNNQKVIHFTSFPGHIWKEGAEVKVTSLYDFIKNTQCIQVLYNAKEGKERIAEKAYARLGERGYSLIFNNCRHFVFSCIY